MKTFLLRHWFLVGLLAVLVMGMVWPERFIYLADSNWFRHGVVATVLFLMSLPLETNALSQTLRRPLPSLLGSFVNMGLMPLMAWGLSRFLTAEFSNGLIVASVVPCTLASAAVWTRRAGGNDAAAILVTVLTNATCFLTTPAWLAITTRKRANLDVDALIWQLVLLVLLPLTAGQLVRISPKIAKWSTAHKHQCSVVSLVGILIMVLVGATQCGTKLKSTAWKDALSWIDIGHLILIVIVLHLMALGTGYLLARVARMSRANQIAVAISGSQKTLMVGIHIAVEHFGGLAILPMVTYHVTQLVIDTLIADRLKRTE